MGDVEICSFFMLPVVCSVISAVVSATVASEEEYTASTFYYH
jgi:hypothetical protein